MFTRLDALIMIIYPRRGIWSETCALSASIIWSGSGRYIRICLPDYNQGIDSIHSAPDLRKFPKFQENLITF